MLNFLVSVKYYDDKLRRIDSIEIWDLYLSLNYPRMGYIESLEFPVVYYNDVNLWMIVTTLF